MGGGGAWLNPFIIIRQQIPVSHALYQLGYRVFYVLRKRKIGKVSEFDYWREDEKNNGIFVVLYRNLKFLRKLLALAIQLVNIIGVLDVDCRWKVL